MNDFLTNIISGKAIPLVLNNIDTDVIIPQFALITTEKVGLGKGLFANWRYLPGSNTPDEKFILNNQIFQHAKILISGENFGCGSSREHAVWALKDYGIDVVIAGSFGEIFFNNCFKNALLPIQTTPQVIKILADLALDEPKNSFIIDLDNKFISNKSDRRKFNFILSEQHKHMLLSGIDDITLTQTYSEKITEYKDNYQNNFPWLTREKKYEFK